MSEDRSRNSQGQKTWLERLAQAFSDEPKDRDDLLELLRKAEKTQVLDNEALSIIEGALSVAEMQAADIMIPRPQMVVINAETSPRDFLPEMIASTHSRFPVIGDSPDEVIGVFLAKDLLTYALNGGIDECNIHDHLRKATFVPETKRLNVLLQEFRENRSHMAIVVDEYGCVSGLVTIEDVLEQIVGEIEDEYDEDDEDTLIKQFENNSFIVKALTPIEDFNAHFMSSFSDNEFDTIGGILTQQFGRLPTREEEVDINGFNFKILNADNRRIRLIQVTPTDTDDSED